MRKLIAGAFVLLLAGPALGEEGDLKQTVSDLTSQTTDKEKMDALGATRVELSQVRGWLNDATNAIKEEAEAKTRRLFELVRAQLKLVDELVALSKLEDEASKLTAQISAVKQKLSTAKNELDEKKAKLRALKMAEGK
jgi:replicative DNA helicase